jgi:chromate transporter
VLFAFLRLGCTSFGGPIAHLGYFRAEFVERRRWLTESTYAELIALAQSMPGPASSQVGFAIGLLRAGWLGGLAAWIGFTLPSAALMLAFAFGYGHPQGRTGAAALHGLQLVAIAVVAQAVVRMQRTLAPHALHLLIALIALFASPADATVLAIAAGALAGLLLMRPTKEPARDRPSFAPPISRPGTAVAAILFVILLTAALRLSASRTLAAAVLAGLYRTGALVFGGGHVVLPLLDAAIVQRGWLAQSSFLGASQPSPAAAWRVRVGRALFSRTAAYGCGPSILERVAPPSPHRLGAPRRQCQRRRRPGRGALPPALDDHYPHYNRLPHCARCLRSAHPVQGAALDRRPRRQPRVHSGCVALKHVYCVQLPPSTAPMGPFPTDLTNVRHKGIRCFVCPLPAARPVWQRTQLHFSSLQAWDTPHLL